MAWGASLEVWPSKSSAVLLHTCLNEQWAEYGRLRLGWHVTQQSLTQHDCLADPNSLAAGKLGSHFACDLTSPAILCRAGNAGEKTRKLYQAKVDAINALEPGMWALSDAQLRGKTVELQQKIAGGASLDDTLAEAFAVSGLLQPLAVSRGLLDTAQQNAEGQTARGGHLCEKPGMEGVWGGCRLQERPRGACWGCDPLMCS